MPNTIKYKYTKWEFVVTLVFILMNGNPFFKIYGETFYVISAFLLGIYLLLKKKELNKIKIIWGYLLIMVLIFIAQTYVFEWNTLPGIINYLSKIFLGGSLLILLREKFKYLYFKIIYYLSVFGLIFWSLKIFAGIEFDLFDWKVGKSILFYYARANEPLRNCGPFWEPGAYGCYLMLIPLLYINQLKELWKQQKNKCIVLIIALISTQSTTTYISFAFFIGLYFILSIKSRIKYIIVPLFLLTSVYLYTTLDFLERKIEHQTETSLEAKGEYNTNRLGSFLFDWHYIEKHPLIGNGLHERTNYADHPWLVQMIADGEIAKSGNGFSGQWMMMGLLFYIAFIYFFIKSNKQNINKKEIFIFLVILFVLTFGEPLFNYPLALSLPFLNLSKSKKSAKFIQNLE